MNKFSFVQVLTYCGAMDDRLSDEVLKSSGRLKQEVNNEQTS